MSAQYALLAIIQLVQTKHLCYSETKCCNSVTRGNGTAESEFVSTFKISASDAEPTDLTAQLSCAVTKRCFS